VKQEKMTVNIKHIMVSELGNPLNPTKMKETKADA